MRGPEETSESGRGWWRRFGSVAGRLWCHCWGLDERVAVLDEVGGRGAAGTWHHLGLHGGWEMESRSTRSGRKYVLLLLWEDAWGIVGGCGADPQRPGGGLASEGRSSSQEAPLTLAVTADG